MVGVDYIFTMENKRSLKNLNIDRKFKKIKKVERGKTIKNSVDFNTPANILSLFKIKKGKISKNLNESECFWQKN